MPNNFVNEIKKDTQVNDINDKRIPEITDNDIGKFLKVRSDKTVEFVDAPGGGVSKLYIYHCSLYLYGMDEEYSSVSGEITDIKIILSEKRTPTIKDLLESRGFELTQTDENIYNFNRGIIYGPYTHVDSLSGTPINNYVDLVTGGQIYMS